MGIRNQRNRLAITALAILLIATNGFGQATPTSALAMRSFLEGNDKFYVVILVISTIFVGIIAFLIFLERKMNKLEKIQKSIKK